MDSDENSPRTVILKRMSYTELRKYAKQKGLRANLKADTLIASILETSADEDSFCTLEQKIINSSKKNKKEKFDSDKQEPSDTPRRGTYTIDDDSNSMEQKEEKFDADKVVPSETPRRDAYTLECPLDVMAVDQSSIFESASPVLRKTPESNANVTLTRGSDKKSLRKRKVSFATPVRRSSRLSTAKRLSIKDRPKTPMPSRLSSNKKVTSIHEEDQTPMGSMSIKSWSPYDLKTMSKLSSGVKRPSTPMPQSGPKKMKLSTEKIGRTSSLKGTAAIQDLLEEDMETNDIESSRMPLPSVSETPVKEDVQMTLFAEPEERKSPRLASVLSSPKTNEKKSVTPRSPSNKKATAQTSAPIIKNTRTPQTKPLVKNSRAVQVTPNFNKMHQKAFEKMESIDEYHRRKALSSAKKMKDSSRFHTPGAASKAKGFASKRIEKIPKKFGGIPFIPSVTSTKSMNTNFSSLAPTSREVLEGSKAKTPQPTRKVLPQRKVVARSRQSNAGRPQSRSIEKGSLKKAVPPFKENKVQQHPRKTKFDLKASLARKLPYKPHSGPLKPLSDTMNCSLHASTLRTPLIKKNVQNRVVSENRAQSRAVLHGVRKNKRFEMQMNNRNLV